MERQLPRVEVVRLEGLDAYARVHEQLAPAPVQEAVAAGETVVAGDLGPLAAGLPPPHPALPLRWLYLIATMLSREGDRPRANAPATKMAPPRRPGLAGWLDEHRAYLEEELLLGETLVQGGERPWQGWMPPAEGQLEFVDWATVTRSWTLDDAREGENALLPFFLLRDYAPDLVRLLDALGVAPALLDEGIARARAAIIADPPPERPFTATARQVQATERELAGGRQPNAWIIFAALLATEPVVQEVFGLDPGVAPKVIDLLDSLPPPTDTRTRTETVVPAAFLPELVTTRDFWTTEDHLGYEPYVAGIVTFLLHESTLPPLTIGIKGPWGAGKTSLMRMVQNRLDPLDGGGHPVAQIQFRPEAREQHAQLGRIHGDGPKDAADARSAAPQARPGMMAALGRMLMRPLRRQPRARVDTPGTVPVHELMSRARSAPASDETVAHVLHQAREGLLPDPASVPNAAGWRPTVWFNPWMYQEGEQIWAGLAHEIIGQVTGRMPEADRERFWLQLNLRRANQERVRWRAYALFARRLLPWGGAAAITLAAVVGLAVAAQAAGWWPWLKDTFAVGIAAVPAAFGAYSRTRWVRFGRERAAVLFPDLVDGPKLLHEAIGFARGEYADERELRQPGGPDYGAKAGFLYLVQTDLKRVLDLVASRERPLVIFVDDLDRCTPAAVTKTIEAINLFLAGQFPNVVFVLAVEPEVVAAHVEASYKDLVAKLGESPLAAQWQTLGWRFLEKIVQVPVSLPSRRPDEAVVAEYVDALLLHETPPAPPADADAAGLQRAEVASRALSQQYAAELRAKGTLPRRALRSEGAAIVTRDRGAGTDGYVAALALEQAVRALDAERQQAVVGAVNDRDARVRAAIDHGVRGFSPANPRQIKRFVNLFRFYALMELTAVLEDGEAQDVPTALAAVDLETVAEVAVLAIRWPELLNVFSHGVGESEEGLQELCDACGDDAKWLAKLGEFAMVSEKRKAEAYDELREFLEHAHSTLASVASRLL